MTIEKRFDIPFIAALAMREKQIQQNYRPIIAVHKWFARRPGTLFRGLILSEFTDEPLSHAFYKPQKLNGVRVADPFMGGGIPLIEANRVGCDIVGYDINPMSYWIVREELEHLDITRYRSVASTLLSKLSNDIGRLYKTKCLKCSSTDASVKYFLWVKTISCAGCGEDLDLFPGYLLAKNQRHTHYVFICPECGELKESTGRDHPGQCLQCGVQIPTSGTAKRNRVDCRRCGKKNFYPDRASGPPRHRMVALEYHCHTCRPAHRGRFFKKPDAEDLALYAEGKTALAGLRPTYLPKDEIPAGDETNRLHRWGYRHYKEMFNARQLLGLELSCRAIEKVEDSRIRNALATNLSDLLRYQNMLCRYDTMALKSLDIFSVHGFPVGLVQCESNFLGIQSMSGVNIGSGGWGNIIDKYTKAKQYCDAPFEVKYDGGKKTIVNIEKEWIGEKWNGDGSRKKRSVDLRCANSMEADIAPNSLDAVFTDPPYFGNVQYAELMDFCYVWLRQIAKEPSQAFTAHSTRHAHELTGNVTLDRGLAHFTEGLSQTFQNMAQGLKPGRALAFTYHHNQLDAYYPLAVAILDAHLVCSASLPCPAEMGASIHINGTGSSILDTILVCRSTGSTLRKWIADTPESIARIISDDIEQLSKGGVKATRGDTRCIIHGHITRLVIWFARGQWDRNADYNRKLDTIATSYQKLCSVSEVEDALNHTNTLSPPGTRDEGMSAVMETHAEYGAENEDIPF
jgi:putative DNA methylase